MTTDYTQPQQYTPPQPAQAQKSSGCLKWLFIGCGVVLVLFLGFIAAITIFVFGAIKRSDAYTGALERVRADQRVIAAIGQPIEPGFWVTGNINFNNGKGNADFDFPISGPRGKARVHTVASNEGQKWEYSELRVTPASGP